MHTAVSDNSPALVSSDVSRHGRDWALPLAVSAAALTLWIVAFGYQGIVHDACLYTLQALGRLHPDLFGSDLYLRFGSQDRYTVFSPIYTTFIGWLGLEHAAALITFLSHVGFFVAAAFLARQLLPGRLALIGVALLIAVPIEYGPGNMFHAIEGFVTPRMAAEALVLAGVAALLSKRYFLIPVFLLPALLLHPLMTMAGVAMVLALTVVIPRPKIAIALIAAAAISLPLLVQLIPSMRLDDAWREIMLDRMGYVFLTQWSHESLARACTPLVALTVGMMLMPASRAKQVGAAAIVIAIAGLALTYYGADFLRITLVAQSQPWRWFWLTNVTTILLLPLIFSACWQRGYAGRATVFALVAMWLFRNDAYGIMLIPLVLGFAAFSRTEQHSSRAARMLYFGSIAAVIFGVVWSVANYVLFAGTINETAGLDSPVTLFRSVSEDGFMTATTFALVWFLTAGAASRTAKVAAALVLAALCVSLLPLAVKEWTQVRYSRANYEALAAWRAQIPVGAEVLYTDPPIDAWVLLERPLYLAFDQTASTLFSRTAALEMDRRDALLARDLPEAHFMMPKTRPKVPGELTLARACTSGEFEFIVTRLDLKAPPLALAPAGAPVFRALRLYKCGTP